MPGSRLELDAHRRLLSELLDGTKQYHAPGFQRPYVWKQKNVDVLCDDIDSLAEDATPDPSTHFLGAIVLVDRSENSTGGIKRCLIVDGQQRLTTLYLYLLALAERLDGLQPGEGNTVVGQYLALQFEDPKAPKVLPTEVDFRQFTRVVALAGFDSAISVPAGGEDDTGDLSKAFERVRRRIRARLEDAADAATAEITSVAGDEGGASPEEGPTAKEVGDAARLTTARRLRMAALTQLKMVEIMLGESDDAFEVFKTLNTLGVDLRPVDLVRSEVFFRADEAKAIHLFKNRWVPMEEALKPDEDKYFFPYALIREPTSKKGELFVQLRRMWLGKDASDVISDICTDIPPYLVTRRTKKEFDDAVKRLSPILGRKWELPVGMATIVARLRRYDLPDVALPFVVRVLREAELGTLPEADAIKSLEAVETFLVRRGIKGVEPTGLHAVFKTLWSETHGGQPSEFLGVIRKRATVEFPSDEEFAKAVREGPLYRRRSIAPYVLYELELAERKKPGDDADRIPILTIDHVMPQNPDSSWKGVSDKDHRVLIDTWANLVPLMREENSKKGNTAWKEIRDYLKVDPDFLTTRRLAHDHTTWTAAAIRTRADKLATWAVARWPLP